MATEQWLTAGADLADRISELVSAGVIPPAVADELGCRLSDVLAGPAAWLKAAIARVKELEAQLRDARAEAAAARATAAETADAAEKLYAADDTRQHYATATRSAAGSDN